MSEWQLPQLSSALSEAPLPQQRAVSPGFAVGGVQWHVTKEVTFLLKLKSNTKIYSKRLSPHQFSFPSASFYIPNDQQRAHISSTFRKGRTPFQKVIHTGWCDGSAGEGIYSTGACDRSSDLEVEVEGGNWLHKAVL